MTYRYALTQDLDWHDTAEWQTPDTPFMTVAFWQALTATGAIGLDTGWVPFYIIVQEAQSQSPLAVMPVFIKSHQRGEYVFDHAWAEAYNRYGFDYYPRLVTSVPFTPITGQRWWLAKGVVLNAEIMQTAMQAVDAIAAQTGASSWHGLYVNDALIEVSEQLNQQAVSVQAIEQDLVRASQAARDKDADVVLDFANSTLPLLERQGCQFLWQNNNPSDEGQAFTDFDAFLMTLTAKKRKNIRAERKKVAKQGISCLLKTAADITDTDWTAFYECYVMTYAVRGQRPYLSHDFFTQLGSTIPENIMLAQAMDTEGVIIASSLFLYDVNDSGAKTQYRRTLYGRYWGALAEYDSLHFELCYYQGIEFAIAQGLQYFDPGTQGEHKLIRGFVPTKTHSLHRIYNPQFVPAIANFCEQDNQHMALYRKQAHEALPFNVDNMPDFKG